MSPFLYSPFCSNLNHCIHSIWTLDPWNMPPLNLNHEPILSVWTLNPWNNVSLDPNRTHPLKYASFKSELGCAQFTVCICTYIPCLLVVPHLLVHLSLQPVPAIPTRKQSTVRTAWYVTLAYWVCMATVRLHYHNLQCRVPWKNCLTAVMHLLDKQQTEQGNLDTPSYGM